MALLTSAFNLISLPQVKLSIGSLSGKMNALYQFSLLHYLTKQSQSFLYAIFPVRYQVISRHSSHFHNLNELLFYIRVLFSL